MAQKNLVRNIFRFVDVRPPRVAGDEVSTRGEEEPGYTQARKPIVDAREDEGEYASDLRELANDGNTLEIVGKAEAFAESNRFVSGLQDLDPRLERLRQRVERSLTAGR